MPESQKLELSPSVAIVLAGVIIAGAILYTNYNPGPAAVAEALPTANVPAPSAQDHRFGSTTAPVVLVEYSDFECPFCSRVYPTLKRLVEESNGQVAWVHRNFPLDSIHAQARPAALAAECIAEQLGSKGFFDFADMVFMDQSQLSQAWYPQAAKALGADAVQFNACLASEKYAARLDAEAADAMKSGGQGTPFTVVYSKGKQVPISGAQPIEKFRAVINSL